jgi:hypothetical protein
MKRALLVTLAATALSSQSYACEFWEAGPDAVGTEMVISLEPRFVTTTRPEGVSFIFYYGADEHFCTTSAVASGYQTRLATCTSADGDEVSSGITWVDFGEPMLRAAVFNGYVFYPGCDL